MGIDVRTNSVWHDVTSASARINGSWHTIKEGYQRRNGAWEQVWPSYKDYGGDTVDIYDDEYFDYYGWVAFRNGANAPTQATLEYYTGNRHVMDGSIGTATNACAIDEVAGLGYYHTGRYNYFSTLEPVDLRGYNYMAFAFNVHTEITDFDTSGHSCNFQIAPLIAFVPSLDSTTEDDGVITIQGETEATGSLRTGYHHDFCCFLDISNCNITGLYLRVGAILASTYNSDYHSLMACIYGQPAHTYSNPENYYCGIIGLYKNKSDCTINGSDYDWSWSLTY